MSISFVDAAFNVADTGTKSNGNGHIWSTLVASNDFTVGFMGRKMTRQYLAEQKPGKEGKKVRGFCIRENL